MADLTPYPDSEGGASVGPDRGSTAGAPRWVKVFGNIAFVLVQLVVVLHLVGGGLGGHTPPAALTQEKGRHDRLDAEAIGKAAGT